MNLLHQKSHRATRENPASESRQPATPSGRWISLAAALTLAGVLTASLGLADPTLDVTGGITGPVIGVLAVLVTGLLLAVWFTLVRLARGSERPAGERRADSAVPPDSAAAPIAVRPRTEPSVSLAVVHLKERVRSLEAALAQANNETEVATAALAAITAESHETTLLEAHSRQVRITIRALQARTTEPCCRESLARVAAAVERLDLRADFARPVLPVRDTAAEPTAAAAVAAPPSAPTSAPTRAGTTTVADHVQGRPLVPTTASANPVEPAAEADVLPTTEVEVVLPIPAPEAVSEPRPSRWFRRSMA